MGIKPKLIITGLLLVCLLNASCVPPEDFDNQLRSIAKPHTFSILGWEIKTISDGTKRLVADKEGKTKDEPEQVIEYFSLVKRIKALRSEIETVQAGNGQDSLATLESRLNAMEGQRAASADIVEKIIKKQIN